MRLAVLLLLFFATAAYAQRMEEGEWEFINEIAMPGLPRPQQSGYRTCLTRDQARDPMFWGRSATVPSDCKVTSVKLGPDYTAWEMDCPASNMRGAGRAQVSRNHMASELKLSGGVHTKTRGQRLGPCKE
ncbi:MAG TPA: DUF3617 family protein [Burkholderiales bacterium]|nr:DUF3617 family protein [Burkholderiales bacterium]